MCHKIDFVGYELPYDDHINLFLLASTNVRTELKPKGIQGQLSSLSNNNTLLIPLEKMLLWSDVLLGLYSFFF